MQAKLEWESLDVLIRDEFINIAKGSKRKAFRLFQQQRIFEELETRDWFWLYTGTIPIARLDPNWNINEILTAIFLNKNGFRVVYIQRSNKERRADFFSQ